MPKSSACIVFEYIQMHYILIIVLIQYLSIIPFVF